jgi:hypothetical protein
MPIKAENRALYPPDWREISLRVRVRACHSCEECGERNYSVGYRDEGGRFNPLRGSGPCDAAGMGRRWPDLNPISYREALDFARASNDSGRKDCDGNRWFVVVITVAHLDHDPRNCELTNLKALCQRCHLRYDAAHHGETASQTRRDGKAMADMFESSAPSIGDKRAPK